MGNTKYGKIDTKRKLVLHIISLKDCRCSFSKFICPDHCHDLCIISKECPTNDYKIKLNLLVQKGLEQNIITEEDIFDWNL